MARPTARPAVSDTITPEAIDAALARARRMRAEQFATMLRAAGRGLRAAFARSPRLAQTAAIPEAPAAGDLSHDLRTPLTAIRSCSEVLIDHPDMPGDHRRRFLGSIHEESLRLERAIDRVLRVGDPSALRPGRP